MLCLTGIILYIEPHGRVAYWIKWDVLGLEKDQWGHIHIFSGLLFLVAGGFHVYYNWNPLMKYLRARVRSQLRYQKELLFSVIILLWIFISGIWALPPLVYVSELGEVIKNAWVISPELEPPFGHAELVSLKTFCKKQRISLDIAMQTLRKAGFSVESPDRTLAEIAASKNTSGMGVYQVIKPLEMIPTIMKSGEAWTAENVEEAFSGTGLGNKAIGQIITDLGLKPEPTLQRLRANDVAAELDDKFKKLAEKHDTTPMKLLTIMLVEGKHQE